MIDETPGAGPDDEPTTNPIPDETPLAESPAPAEPEAAAPGEDPERASLREAVAAGEQPQVLGADQVAEHFRVDQEQGFHGQEVDQTPNEEYTSPNPPEGTDAA